MGHARHLNFISRTSYPASGGYYLLAHCSEIKTKMLNCVRGRRPQARDPDCGFNPLQRGKWLTTRREESSCDDQRKDQTQRGPGLVTAHASTILRFLFPAARWKIQGCSHRTLGRC